ncbi:MAG TPA: translation elongation factor Ts, partial [Planctomycetota bacterium]|nr:translation elongation factor Ts [Planctomycetota bacterium]
MAEVNAKLVKELRDRTEAPMMDCRNALVEAGGDVEAAIKILKEKGKTKAAKRADRETLQGLVALRTGPGNQGGAAVVCTCETDFSARNEMFQRLLKAALDAAWKLPEGSSDVEAALAMPVAEGGTLRDLITNAIATVGENMTLKAAVRLGGTCSGYVHFDQRSCALVSAEVGDAAKAATPEIAALLRDVGMHAVAAVPPPIAIDRAGVPQELIASEKEIFVKRAIESGKPANIAEKMVGGQIEKFVAERALL